MMQVGNLEISTPSPREIAMTRVFDAPRQLVFEAWTKPELIKRWLGALDGWSMPVCEVDLRVGGAYRYVWRGPDETRWAWAASFARSSRPIAWSAPSSSTTRGTRARRSKPWRSSKRRAERR